MPDILPINITSISIPATPQLLSPDITNLVTVSIKSLPESFLQLSSPLQLNGIITNIMNNGDLFLRSGSGEFVFNMPQSVNGKSITELVSPFTQDKRPLAFSLAAGSPPTHATLILPQITSAVSEPTKIINTNQNTKMPVSPMTGLIFSAVVLPENPLLKNITDFSFEIPSKQHLADITEKHVDMATPNTLTKEAPNNQNTDSQIKQHIAANKSDFTLAKLRTGSEINFRISSVMQGEAGIQSAMNSEQMVATVITKGTDGQLLLSVGEKALYVRQNIDLPVGSKMLLTLASDNLTEDLFWKPKNSDIATALNHLIGALGQIDPKLTQHLMQNRIPQTNSFMPETLLFLLSALHQGNIKEWLGEIAASKLEKAGKRELIGHLADELQQAGGTSRDAAVGEWKTFPVPFYDGSQFSSMRIHVHRDDDFRQNRDKDNAASIKTRFVIDLNMTKLGAMQIDGLSQTKQLDIVVRSDNVLPDHLPTELRLTYINTLEAFGLKGSIVFQNGRQSWMNLQRDTKTTVAGITT